MVLNETYILSNGVKIPKLGLGTWMIDNEAVVQFVKDVPENTVVAGVPAKFIKEI